MTRPVALVIALLLLTASLAAGAQTGSVSRPSAAPAPSLPSPNAAWVHEAWSTKEGLPVNAINGLMQSSSGYIWIATYDGLVRFDGVRFTTFNSANSPGLPSDRIIEVVETPDGVLWLRTEQFHLVRFAGGRFTQIDSARGLESAVSSLHVDTRGALWVGTMDGVGVARDSVFESVVQLPQTVQGITVRRDGSVWAGTRGAGLYRIANGRAARVVLPDARDSLLLPVVSLTRRVGRPFPFVACRDSPPPPHRTRTAGPRRCGVR